MKQRRFASGWLNIMLALLLTSSCAAPQRLITATSAPLATRALPKETVPAPSALPSPVESVPTQPVTIAPESSDWLREHTLPFDTTDPGSDFTELVPLKKWIGDVRIVALGEATHGTHEFFEMKHRMLRFLVEEMGFNTFAIEANLPEANLLNDYLHTGQGDPAALLDGLHFWTWDTQEVLDMILWMRAHNENPGAAPLVSFAGFDMQFYTMAMDNVLDYLEQVDPDRLAQTIEQYRCFRLYSGRALIYERLSADTKTACRANLQAVYDQLTNEESAYKARSSPEDFAWALENARIVIQAEDNNGAGEAGYMLRDRYMAENVTWLLEQAGPQAKIVLWAHNFHVGTYDPSAKTMGAYLRETYGEEMLVFGFSFYQGSFNARDGSGPLSELSVEVPPANSYEYYFHTAGLPRFFLDLRGIPTESAAADWLTSPHPFRAIGSVYDSSRPEEEFTTASLADVFDIIIYFQDTSPSLLLHR